MFYIYEKNLDTGQSKFFMNVSDRSVAEQKVRELNSYSLFEDKFYFIQENK
jgi:hypothetical protein